MKIKIFSPTFLLLVLTLNFVSPKLWAQDEGGAQFGMIGGFSVPDADNSSPRMIHGFKGAAFISPNFSLGGYYLLHGKNQGSGGRKFQYSLHGIEAAYHVPSGSGDTFVALRAGLSKVHTEVESTQELLLYSPNHFGLTSGFDYFITSWFSLGFEGSFIKVQASRTSVLGTVYNEDSFSIINFLVSMQFRL